MQNHQCPYQYPFCTQFGCLWRWWCNSGTKKWLLFFLSSLVQSSLLFAVKKFRSLKVFSIHFQSPPLIEFPLKPQTNLLLFSEYFNSIFKEPSNFVWFKFLEVLYVTWEGTFLQLFLGFWAYYRLIEMLIKLKQAMSRRSTVVSTSLTKSVLLTIVVRSAICCCYIGM
jgi:hypothetical protein